jgi:ABC-type transport system involved in multi-copper enzyme maturation permease subunit
MSNVVTLLRRELGQLFRSPVAYVFLVLFVFFVQLPYMLQVFLGRAADLRGFFGLLPWFVVVFAALVTMRSWAEERQENTYEMLLTFPMRNWELVVAKFVATYLFLCFGIACTVTLPIMLLVLGEPDVGPILTGYLGAFLVSAAWCAAGVFFSSLTRSQLLAAIVTLVLGVVSLFVGVTQVAEVINGKVDGLGSVLSSVLGTWSHYDALGRGVLEIADVLFFLIWTAVFLYLNTLFVGMRRAPRAGAILTAGTFLAVGCGFLGARLVADASIARADVTEERIYTLSQGTVNVLKRAAVPVRATFYVSPRDDMPAEMQNLERDVVDRLEEMRLQSGGMVDVRVVHMEAANLAVKTEEEQQAEDAADELSLDEDKSIERRLIEKGVQPFQVQSFEATEVTSKYVYATLGLAYEAKDEELITPVVPARLQELEYLVASTVARLVREAPPRIALHLGQEPLDPQVKQMLQRMGRPIPDPYAQVEQFLRQEKFDVVRTRLSQHDPMPQDYDALVVIGPVEWNDRSRWELNRALVSGKPVFLAAQRYTWDYEPARGGGIIPRLAQADPGLEAVLGPQGLGIAPGILMQAENAYSLRVQTNNALQNLMGGIPLRMPTHIGLLADNFSGDSAITDRIDGVLYLWGTALDLDRDALLRDGFDVTVLAETGDSAWEVPADRPLRNADLEAEGQELGRFPLIAMIEGDFSDVFAGGERPDWPATVEMSPDGRPLPPPPDLPAAPFTARRGKLILCGAARAFQDGILGNPGNQLLLINSISALTLDPDLLEVRSKQPRSRQFSEPTSGEALFWTAVPLVIVPLLLIGAGLFIGFLRMRSRERWNAEHGR